jgi:hypothetical protein
MLTHVKVVAVLYIVLGALGVLAALLLMMVFGVAAGSVGVSGDPDAAVALPIIGFVGTGLFIFLLAISLPGIVVGFGLLKLRPWARIGGIVLSAINLINLPLGTILGIYGLVILLNKETEQLFNGSAALSV